MLFDKSSEDFRLRRASNIEQEHLHILHVCPAFFPATYWGGPTFSTYNLCNALARQAGVSLEVLTTDTAGPALSERVPVSTRPINYDEGYPVWFAPKRLGVDIAPGLLPRLWARAQQADVIHLTATYSFTTLPTLAAARRFSKPIVWSPRGAIQATDEWKGAGNKSAKKAFHRLAQLLAPPTLLLHATAETEAQACRRQLPGLDVFVSPNGVDCPEELPQRSPLRTSDPIRLIFLGRLHEKKGLDIIFQALRALPERFSLDVYGAGDAKYIDTLCDLISSLGLHNRVTLKGPVDGEAKSAALLAGDIFLLPSHSENFGIAIAEALAHGLPVVVSQNTPWQAVESRGCGAWVPNTPHSFKTAILEIAAGDVREQGRMGRAWMKSEYRWDTLGERMASVYRRLARKPVGL